MTLTEGMWCFKAPNRETVDDAIAPPVGVPASEDGESWSPVGGVTLDDDELMQCAKESEDAQNLSKAQKLGIGHRYGKLPVAQLQPPVEGRMEDEEASLSAEAVLGEGSGSPLTIASAGSGLCGLTFGEGSGLLSQLWNHVSSLELHCKAQTSGKGLFPLPTIHNCKLASLLGEFTECPECFFNLTRALNSLAGYGFGDHGYEGAAVQIGALKYLRGQADRVCAWPEKFDELNWDSFFQVKSIDYKGEEVMTAKFVEWRHLAPAIPEEVATVNLLDVVELGMHHYVSCFEEYLIPEDDMIPMKGPRVMIPPDAWEEVAQGLISKGICGILGEDEVFKVKGVPVLNGLFGVSKNEWQNEVEIHRLIMNLIPINSLCRGVEGDVGTLPGLSTLTPLFLDDDEHLVISSEDVRCFFYIFKVPATWRKYMCFNRALPPSLCPRGGKAQRYYLCSLVLPMGFKNSVSIAQHVHRNIVKWSGGMCKTLGESSAELRKDRSFSFANPLIRIYLDNFDLLKRVDKRTAALITGEPSAESLALRCEYEKWGIPKHPKKSVCQETIAEVQGAVVDGSLGLAFPKKEKVLKYVQLGVLLLQKGEAGLKQLQVIGGGLVYLAMFRRPVLGSLNHIWQFMVELDRYPPVTRLPLPPVVQLELIRFISLVPLCFMDFRPTLDSMVTASDASTTGGGVTASRDVTQFGSLASQSLMRGDVAGLESHSQILSMGLFDGIGALRLALDALNISSLGHVSVESSSVASRVVESHFAGTIFVDDVLKVDENEVFSWSCKFSQVSLVILGAGPPCQGVSGLNSERKGALRDKRSSLFKEVKRIHHLVKRNFPWAMCHLLMESVQSMDEADREVMSEDIELQPWAIDAKGVSLARRPRFYWVSWDLIGSEGASILPPVSTNYADYGMVELTAKLTPSWYLEPGWKKASEEPFPTFTTSRPRSHPGPRPAGIKSCTDQEKLRWQNDAYRFPPYQYRSCFSVVNSKQEERLVNVSEREAIMGFPIGYTLRCFPKSKSGGADHTDARLSLIGNSWNVTVVTWLLSQLLFQLGLGRELSAQDCVLSTAPGQSSSLQGLLLRPPMSGHLVKVSQNSKDALTLVKKLTGVVSIKGEDIMLNAPSDVQSKHQRLRASIPSRLWRWRTICGWRWKGEPEHINCLELRAALTTLRWRFEKKLQVRVKFVHLVDSLVVLHALSRGRSSSRKLRRSLLKTNAFLLATGSTASWAYVHTSDNPADRPSRRPVRKQWVK